MKKEPKNKTVGNLLLILLEALLVFGGLGIKTILVYKLGLVLSFAFVIFAWALSKKIKFPSGSVSFGLFLLFFGISLFWSRDWQVSFNYLLLFASGGLFWLVFFNLKEKYKNDLDNLVVALGILFGLLYLVFKLRGGVKINHLSLFLPTSSPLIHNHIGDLWAVVLSVVITLLLSKKKWIYIFLTVFGTYFLLMSFSRSAYIAFLGGILYIFWKKGWLAKFKYVFWLLVLLTVALFLSVSTQKTLLFSRPYFVQALAGIVDNPLGVGVGNFGIISKDKAYQLFRMTNYSNLTHNIILEILVGMGVFGLFFITWFIKVTKEVFSKANPRNLFAQIVFITLGINFLFDYTYFIPTMLWLWFISLGLF